MAETTETNYASSNRERIARTVAYTVLISTLVVTGIALVMIWTDKRSEDRWSSVKDVFAIVFPLWGTWIGTVLAYYFSKDNFAAANQSVKDLVATVTGDQKLKTLPANDKRVMIGLRDIRSYKYTTADEMGGKKLTEFIQFMKTNSVTRLPFLDTSNKLYYCIHRSIFDKYLSERALETPAVNLSELTFNDLLTTSLDEMQSYIKSSVQFAKEDATLLDIKIIMEKNKFCEDVFLTKSGTRDEPVIGWITNDIILEKSKA